MVDIPWYLYIAVVAAGFLAGFINTLAGSGSLVTLPLLIFLGLPANIANGTNRIAILLQNMVSVSSFDRQGILNRRGTLMLSAPMILGALLGANIAVNLNETMMRHTIGALMLVMLVVIIARPNSWLHGEMKRLESRPALWQFGLFFVIGIYGGFIQVGVGIFLLAGLVLGIGYDLVRANAIKVGAVLIFTIFALGVFILNKQVNWPLGLVLALGNMLGAWVAARVAVDKGAAWVRRLLIIIVVISATNLLGLWSF